VGVKNQSSMSKKNPAAATSAVLLILFYGNCFREDRRMSLLR
jgi:hypothetical protein